MFAAIGVGVGPGAAVPMRTKDDAVLEFGAVGGDDVVALQLLAIPALEGGLLLLDLQAVALELCDDIGGAAVVGRTVGDAGAEIALGFYEGEG
ncbi:hypothetical protein GCWU000325_01504 [Alloprevotella tannerae ATCC 51259]|uniref:Uncharacterized protein n=1 Tax=Alloprevotella tannerae ATCC 51259 TaxID=626522 RepID=C9LH03_9BACT|nr:hypothetical protein GCWU000325_01504 [Alloprevotella tannerae ATCC 51259]